MSSSIASVQAACFKNEKSMWFRRACLCVRLGAATRRRLRQFKQKGKPLRPRRAFEAAAAWYAFSQQKKPFNQPLKL
jgi:hypothetical protein